MIAHGEPLLAVLYDAADVQRFLEERQGSRSAALPLTPAAEAALAGSGTRIVDARAHHGRYAHYRDVVRGERIERALEAEFSREHRLSLTARQCLVDQAVRACHVSSRLWSTLRAGSRWRVPVDDGWIETSSRAEAHRVLLRRIFATQPHYRFAPTPGWLRLALHVAACLLCVRIGQTRPVVFHSAKRGFAALVEDMDRRNAGLWRVQFVPVTADRRSLSRLVRLCADVWRGRPVRSRVIPITVPPVAAGEWDRLLRRVLDTSSDPVTRSGIETIWSEIAGRLSRLESVRGRYRLYLRLARPRAAVVWDLAEPLNVLVAEQAKASGVPVVLVTHTSVSAGERAGTQRAKRRHTRQLVAHDLADITLVQSPYAEQAALQYGPQVPQGRIRPLVWGAGVRRREHPAKEGRRTILYAANYFEWSAYMPVCYETSTELVANLKHLAAAIGTMPGCRLVIRMKANFGRKAEFTETTLRALLPPDASWEIRSSGSFYDDLAEADLVVSYHSTVIEEAFLARCPVLLLGGGNDYRHVPASTTVPPARSPAECFAPPDEESLGDMVRAILGRPSGLVDSEGAPSRIWPDGTAGLAEVSSILTDDRLDRRELVAELGSLGVGAAAPGHKAGK